ncbi:MAG: amidohydrolase family protein [Vulcanimicrobiota bacterium]
MVIDFHVHIGESLFDREQSEIEIQNQMRENGIERSVLVPFKPREYFFPSQNDLIAGFVEQNPGVFYGFGRIDPWQKQQAVTEITRIFLKLKLSGLFLDPWEENCPVTSRHFLAVVEQAGKFQKPIMVSGGHARVSHPRQLEFLAKEFPGQQFIFTSAGQINICGLSLDDARQMLNACPNVTMETSGIYRRDFIEQMAGEIGAHRIVFGSGSPYYDMGFELERIKTAKINPEEKEFILAKNAENILEEK